MSTPFIVNTWFAGLIVQDFKDSNWRWGYGMIAIIMPVILSPGILVLQYKAQKEGKVSLQVNIQEKPKN